MISSTKQVFCLCKILRRVLLWTWYMYTWDMATCIINFLWWLWYLLLGQCCVYIFLLNVNVNIFIYVHNCSWKHCQILWCHCYINIVCFYIIATKVKLWYIECCYVICRDHTSVCPSFHLYIWIICGDHWYIFCT